MHSQCKNKLEIVWNKISPNKYQIGNKNVNKYVGLHLEKFL